MKHTWTIVALVFSGAMLWAGVWGIMTIIDWRTHPGGDITSPEKYQPPLLKDSIDWKCPPGKKDCKG